MPRMVPSARHRAIIVPAASSAGKSSLASTGRSLREILLPMKMPEMICVSSFREEGTLASPVAMLSAATKIIEPTRYPPGTCRFPSSIPPHAPTARVSAIFPASILPVPPVSFDSGLAGNPRLRPFFAAFCIQAKKVGIIIGHARLTCNSNSLIIHSETE